MSIDGRFSLRTRLALALVALVAISGLGCDDFPSVALQNDLDGPVGITWSDSVIQYGSSDEILVSAGRETTLLVSEGMSLDFTLRYDGQTYELSVPWDRYVLMADQIGDSDFRIFLSHVLPPA